MGVFQYFLHQMTEIKNKIKKESSYYAMMTIIVICSPGQCHDCLARKEVADLKSVLS